MKKINAEIKIKGRPNSPLTYFKIATGETWGKFTIQIPTNTFFKTSNGEERIYCNFFDIIINNQNVADSLVEVSNETMLQVTGYLKFNALQVKTKVDEIMDGNMFSIKATIFATKIRKV